MKSVVVFERLIGDGLLRDAEFRERLARLPEPGPRLLLWILEQQWIEQDISADDNLSGNQMKAKIAESRKRPVGELSELEQTVIREALGTGGISAGTIMATANVAMNAYFLPTNQEPAT